MKATAIGIDVTELFKDMLNDRDLALATKLTDLAVNRYLDGVPESYYAALRVICDLNLVSKAAETIAQNCEDRAPNNFILTQPEGLNPVDKELSTLRAKVATGLLTGDKDACAEAGKRVKDLTKEVNPENKERIREYLIGVIDLLVCAFTASLVGRSEPLETMDAEEWKQLKDKLPQPNFENSKTIHPHRFKWASIQVQE